MRPAGNMKPARSLPRRARTKSRGHSHDLALLNQVLEHVTNAIFALNLEGQFILVNRAGAKISGYDVDELIGRPFTLLFPPETLPQAMLQFQQVMAGKTVSDFEIELVRKDGTRRLLNIDVVPLRENGRVASVVGMAEDVTERKRAEEARRQSEERFSKVFRSQHALITITRLADGRFVDVNENFLKSTGYRTMKSWAAQRSTSACMPNRQYAPVFRSGCAMPERCHLLK